MFPPKICTFLPGQPYSAMLKNREKWNPYFKYLKKREKLLTLNNVCFEIFVGLGNVHKEYKIE